MNMQRFHLATFWRGGGCVNFLGEKLRPVMKLCHAVMNDGKWVPLEDYYVCFPLHMRSMCCVCFIPQAILLPAFSHLTTTSNSTSVHSIVTRSHTCAPTRVNSRWAATFWLLRFLWFALLPLCTLKVLTTISTLSQILMWILLLYNYYLCRSWHVLLFMKIPWSSLNFNVWISWIIQLTWASLESYFQYQLYNLRISQPLGELCMSPMLS